jgi:integrase
MLGKISKQTVDRLAPGSLIWDTSLVGFGVRRQLKHPHYVVRYRLNGKQKLVTIGRHGAWTPESARRKAQEFLGIVATGVDPAAAKAAEGDNFLAVAERFLAHQRGRLKPRSITEVERYLRKHALPLHWLRLAQIDRRAIAEALSEVERQCGPVARNRFRSNLSAMFAWAITEGLIEDNPVQGTAKADENGGRERVLTEAEIKALWNACADNSDFSRIVRLLLLTGQRRNEIGFLQCSEVNLGNSILTLPAECTKNGREHTLPLSKQAVAILQAITSRTGALFATTNWASEKVKLDARLNLPHWTLHDLRRTAATGMIELGTAPHVVEAVLNHVSGHKAGVAGIYNRSKLLEPMREALQRWADHVEALIAGPREQAVPTGLMERALAVARGGKIVPNEDLANLASQLKNNALKRS